MKKNKKNAKQESAKRKVNPETFKLIRAIDSGDNVEAYKLLEKIAKKKIADKIDKALKEEG